MSWESTTSHLYWFTHVRVSNDDDGALLALNYSAKVETVTAGVAAELNMVYIKQNKNLYQRRSAYLDEWHDLSD